MGSRNPKSSKRKSSKAGRSKVSRRTKSKKKHSRRDHSVSSYSDDDSVSSVSSYSSSSEEEYRSRKGRSRSKSDAKSKSRRAERRVLKSESSEDTPLVRKRKRSSKKRSSEYKKKPQKKRRRYDSSSDSLGCSSCQYESSSSSDEAESDSPRGRSRKKIRDKRGSDKHKVGSKRSRNKSEDTPQSEDLSNFHSVSPKVEEHELANNVRRLRSVITVVKHPEENEDNQLGRDYINEENVSENNDSDNGARENKLAYNSDIVSDKNRFVQDTTDQESFVLKNVIGECEPAKVEMSGSGHCSDEDKEKALEESGDVGRVNDSTDNVNVTGSGSDDLELVLRQKALENLKKFRGKPKGESNMIASPKVNNNLDDNQPLFANSETSDNIVPKAEVVKQSHIQQSHKSANSKSVNRGHINPPAVGESETGTPAMQDDSLCTYSTLKQDSRNENPLDGKSNASKTIPESLQPLTHEKSDKLETEAINAQDSTKAEPTSSIRRTSEEQSSNNQQAEDKDSSQFQQKTMSVMRSGEMVQVSYKVYIPKRAPALARRKLKR